MQHWKEHVVVAGNAVDARESMIVIGVGLNGAGVE